MKPGDSQALHNLPMVLKVGLVKRNDNGEMTNQIKGYRAKGEAAEAQPQATRDTAPWKRPKAQQD